MINLKNWDDKLMEKGLRDVVKSIINNTYGAHDFVQTSL